MSTCASCGGILGRDCFNPGECAAITADMAARAGGGDPQRAAAAENIVALAADFVRICREDGHAKDRLMPGEFDTLADAIDAWSRA